MMSGRRRRRFCQTETKFLGIYPNAASRNTKAIHCDFDFRRDDDDEDIDNDVGERAPHIDVYRHYDGDREEIIWAENRKVW